MSWIIRKHVVCSCESGALLYIVNTVWKCTTNIALLAHLSRRLIGELIVYPCSGVRPSVVRPSVRRPSVVHNFKDLLL